MKQTGRKNAGLTFQVRDWPGGASHDGVLNFKPAPTLPGGMARTAPQVAPRTSAYGMRRGAIAFASRSVKTEGRFYVTVAVDATDTMRFRRLNEALADSGAKSPSTT